MNYNELFNAILSALKQKGILSDFEKDILSTMEKYIENPFDENGARNKIRENNLKYPEITSAIAVKPGIETKPVADLTRDEIKNSLYLQIEAMWVKRGMQDLRW